MYRRLPVLALAALLGLASACARTGDLTGPDAARPGDARFSESEDNGGTFGNGNVAGGSGEGGLGSGNGGVAATDGGGDTHGDDALDDNGGMHGSGG